MLTEERLGSPRTGRRTSSQNEGDDRENRPWTCGAVRVWGGSREESGSVRRRALPGDDELEHRGDDLSEGQAVMMASLAIS